jgi:cobaltochelatase CobT
MTSPEPTPTLPIVEGTQYKPYTTKFDVTVAAVNLDSVLGPLNVTDQLAVDAAWHELQTSLLLWRTKLHLVAAETATRIRAALSSDQRCDTIVSLLFDQSGSMRGQKILFAAASADVAQEFLLTLKISVEILGFTTSKWKGGRSRTRWKWRFRPKKPGRLNDLLHIIYRDADDKRASTGDWSFRQMLRPDLTKENIDGEAIEWAASRLLAAPESRKILIVLSDGAPVDDSTLTENGPTYLGDHLRQVVDRISTDGQIELAAMGIGYRTHEFYAISDHVEAPDELGTALVSFIEKLLTK